MSNVRWLSVCRWVHVVLVVGYVFVTIMVVIVLLSLFGVRMASGVRWVMLLGWFAMCFGGVLLVERLGLLSGQGCRRPIRSEAERLSALMHEARNRLDSKRWLGAETKSNAARGTGENKEPRFLIGSDAESKDRSLGSRTIVISSGTFHLASDEELLGILAHELGHLRDGDRILEAAALCSGVTALGFRSGCRLIREGFRFSFTGGLLLLAFLSPVLLSLFFFFCVDSVFRGLIGGLVRWGEFRQDCFTARIGCGKGLRDWLEKSGLAVNVDRIRRLEKML